MQNYLIIDKITNYRRVFFRFSLGISNFVSVFERLHILSIVIKQAKDKYETIQYA